MFKNIIQSLFTKGGVAAINLGILIVSSHYLGVSSRGEISLFLLNIVLIQGIIEVYTGYGLIQIIPRFNLSKIYKHGLLYTVILCAIANGIIHVFDKHIPGYSALSFIVSVLVVINTFNCVILLGLQKIQVYNMMSLIQPFLLISGIVYALFYLQQYTFNSYVWPLFFSFLIATVVSTALVLKAIPNQQTQNLLYKKTSILRNGFMYQSALLMYICCNRYGYYMIPEKAELGLYSSATVLTESVLMFTTALSPLILTKVANNGNTSQSIKITLTLSALSFVLCAFGLLLLLLLPESFYLLFLGEGFVGIQTIMKAYSPAVMAASLFLVLSNYFTAIGLQKIVLMCYALGLSTVLLLTPVLMNWYGIKGVAYSVNGAFILIACGLVIAFLKKNKLSPITFLLIAIDIPFLKQLVIKKEN